MRLWQLEASHVAGGHKVTSLWKTEQHLLKKLNGVPIWPSNSTQILTQENLTQRTHPGIPIAAIIHNGPTVKTGQTAARETWQGNVVHPHNIHKKE